MRKWKTKTHRGTCSESHRTEMPPKFRTNPIPSKCQHSNLLSPSYYLLNPHFIPKSPKNKPFFQKNKIPVNPVNPVKK